MADVQQQLNHQIEKTRASIAERDGGGSPWSVTFPPTLDNQLALMEAVAWLVEREVSGQTDQMTGA